MARKDFVDKAVDAQAAKIKKRSFEDRVDNAYGHEAENLKAREELIKRGVKKNDPNLPHADYTYKPLNKVADRKNRGK